MKSYGVFKEDTGMLISACTVSDDMPAPVEDGHKTIEGSYQIGRHFMTPDGQVVDAGNSPGLFYFLDGANGYQPDIERAEIALRYDRNRLLADSDYIELQILRTELAELQGKPMLFGRIDSGEAEAWRKYRQELRDITKQAGFPMEVVWPEPPTGR